MGTPLPFLSAQAPAPVRGPALHVIRLRRIGAIHYCGRVADGQMNMPSMGTPSTLPEHFPGFAAIHCATSLARSSVAYWVVGWPGQPVLGGTIRRDHRRTVDWSPSIVGVPITLGRSTLGDDTGVQRAGSARSGLSSYNVGLVDRLWRHRPPSPCLAVPWRSTVATPTERQADTGPTAVCSIERYERGAEMLGSRVLSVRLGGIYALEHLAAEHPQQSSGPLSHTNRPPSSGS